MQAETQILHLWGKLGTGETFHPALYHMLDVGHVAAALLSPEASPRWRIMLSRALGADDVQLRTCVPLLVALHDIGKISAGFQARPRAKQKDRLVGAGFTFPDLIEVNAPHHTVVGAAFVRDEWAKAEQRQPPHSLVSALADAAGGHHGVFLADGALACARREYLPCEGKAPEWTLWRKATYHLLRRYLCPTSGDSLAPWPEPSHRSAAVMALVGFTILCDWLGSDARPEYFPVTTPRDGAPDPEAYVKQSHESARRAVVDRGWRVKRQVPAYPGFAALFPDDPPRPLQQAIDEIPPETIDWPALYIIEAPTGEGKTEAALALARRLAAHGGTDELYVALPTMATSNAMHGRIEGFVTRVIGGGTEVRLVHGQAHLARDDQKIQPHAAGPGADAEGEDNAVAAQDWFAPKKRALLAPFGTGTVDQLELGALNARHYMLRLAGLAGKVVIVDEVHAYDTYMSTVLAQALRWLATLGSSVILLSATLPAERRERLAEAFRKAAAMTGSATPTRATPAGQSQPRLARRRPLPVGQEEAFSPQAADLESEAYPLISAYTAGGVVRLAIEAHQPDRRVAVRWLPAREPRDTEAEARNLLDLVRNGGVACQMCNTVEGAQTLFRAVEDLASNDDDLQSIELHLLHARLPLEERLERESDLVGRFGRNDSRRPKRAIVVGTQVLEQSLDVDFDVLIADLAPLDLLLQRIGRLHRHDTHPYRGPHTIPRVHVRLARREGGAPDFGPSIWVYSQFILWKSLVALEALMVDGIGEIVLPRDYRPLVEQTYDDAIPSGHRWENAMRDALSKHEAEQRTQQEGAQQRVIPDPDPRESPALGQQHVFDEDAKSDHWIAARTRWGDEGITVIPLHLIGDRLCIFPDASEPLPPLRGTPDRDLQLRLLRRGLPVNHRDLVEALWPGRAPQGQGIEADAQRWFKRSALLRQVAPLVLREYEGKWQTVIGGRLMILDKTLGLGIERP